jgi:hypothetical protein
MRVFAVILAVVGGLVGLSFADAPTWAWVIASLAAVALVTVAYVRLEAREEGRP